MEKDTQHHKPHDPSWQSNTCSWNPDGPFEGLPELRFFQFADLRKAKMLFEHRHVNAFEFMFIEKGKASWEVNGTHHETRSGDVFCTLPNELHRASYNIIEPCTLWSVIIDTPLPHKGTPDSPNPGWLQMNPYEIEEIQAGLYTLPRVISVKLTARDILQRLARCVDKKEPFFIQDGKLALLDFLLLLLRSKPGQEHEEDTILWKIEKLTGDMEQQPYWRPTVPELAKSIGVSTSYFYNVFQEYTRLSPLVYMERLRIKEACRRLKESDDLITQISLDLGYTTSQHFATVFKRLTGRSPSQWRASEDVHTTS
jgi:AraC-like DNA-binding protein